MAERGLRRWGIAFDSATACVRPVAPGWPVLGQWAGRRSRERVVTAREGLRIPGWRGFLRQVAALDRGARGRQNGRDAEE